MKASHPLLAVLAASAAVCSVALGQSITPPPPTATSGQTSASSRLEEAIELSPFVISATAETGWIATETLAGSRLRTDFKDVPNQIETLTKDFMSDLGLTSLDQALIYTANVENSSDYVPATAGSQVSDPGLGGRVRGIGSGTLTRNFFKVSNPTDNFNIERATVASGPNAILFGLGSPAGILDASPARALMRNRYGFELTYDSENSKRATFDANTVVVPQKFSLRLMGLSKRDYTEKSPNLDRDERLYGAVTFKPFKSTTLVVQAEKDSRNWNRAGRIVPTDQFSPWLIADKVAGSGYTTAKPTYDNTSVTGVTTNRIFTQGGNSPVVIQGGSVPTRSWNQSVTVRSPGTLPGVDQTFDAGGGFTVLDPKIFPFDVNIVGNARTSQIGGITKTIILEQKIIDTLFLELAANRENAINHKLSGGASSGSSDFALNVDANRFIPGTTTSNPNVGQLYYQGGASNTIEHHDRDDWRATLSYELDLARKLGGAHASGWKKYLGRHRFSGLYTGSKSNDLSQQSFDRRILDDPVIPGVTLTPRTTANWATNATRTPQFRHYFTNPYEPTQAAVSMTGDVSLNDANGRPYTLYLYDTPFRAPDGKRLGGGQVASGSLNQSVAQIFAWQGFFLPDRERHDRLVLTYGYRKDSAKSANLDADSTRQDFSGLFPILWDTRYAAYGPTQTGINRNIGVVARPLKWLTAFYNQSTTFDLNIGRYDPFGNDIPGAGGDGRDYGIRLDLFTDKLTLRVNRYTNQLGPQRASNAINIYRDIFFNIEQRVLALDPTAPTINVTDGNKRGYRTAGRPNYFIMSDFESKGYEVELNFSPTRAWNIRLNGAKSEAVESNIGGPWYAWRDARLPVWTGVVAKNGERDAAGQAVTWKTAPYSAAAPTGQTLEQYYNSSLVGQALAFMTAADGRATATARGGRANAIVNYRFSEGRLKGFNVGGAFRWRSAPTIGYGIKTNSTGTVLLDLDKAYQGKTEGYLDLLAAYRGKMKAFGNLNYRVQINVRNALNENDPIPVGALTTGAISRLATVDSRVTQLTFAVDF
jgi:iron complex outermembrane receptor protein